MDMDNGNLTPLRIRPRRFGLGVLAVTVAMLLAAINYGNNLIFLLAFVMLALMINSAWQGWRALASVQIQALPPSMRSANTRGELTVNLVSRPGLPALQLSLGGNLPAVTTILSPRERTSTQINLPAAPRGYLPLPAVTLRTGYPLGLWRVERHYRPGIGQWLHPAPVEGPRQDASPGHVSDSGSHDATAGDPTRLRDYQPGDPLRGIVFRHYAKTGRLVSRQAESEPHPVEPTVINYDHYLGSRETRLSAMTQRLLALSQANEPWTLCLPDHPPVGATGVDDAGQLRQALRLLARAGRLRDADGFDLLPTDSGEQA